MTSFEAFAVDLARAAAAVILPLFRTDCGEEDKGGPGAFDPVTQADRDAEAAMRRLITERFPDHGVIGEEYGEDRPDAEYVWVLDPVDGTRAFVAGLPLWTTLIALRHEGRPVTGVIAQPVMDEIFLGGPSGAVLLKGGEAPLPAQGSHLRPPERRGHRHHRSRHLHRRRAGCVDPGAGGRATGSTGLRRLRLRHGRRRAH